MLVPSHDSDKNYDQLKGFVWKARTPEIKKKIGQNEDKLGQNVSWDRAIINEKQFFISQCIIDSRYSTKWSEI